MPTGLLLCCVLHVVHVIIKKSEWIQKYIDVCVLLLNGEFHAVESESEPESAEELSELLEVSS